MHIHDELYNELSQLIGKTITVFVDGQPFTGELIRINGCIAHIHTDMRHHSIRITAIDNVAYEIAEASAAKK